MTVEVWHTEDMPGCALKTPLGHIPGLNSPAEVEPTQQQQHHQEV